MIHLKRNDTGDTIRFTATQPNGEVVNLTGATARFLMGNKKSLITNAAATIVDPAQGIIEYTLTENDTILAGDFPAEFEVTFADGDVTTFPRKDYILVSIESNIDKNKTEEIVLRVSLVEQFKAETTAQVNNIQAQVNQLVVEGDSSVETAQARVDSSGTAYATLKARLDAEHTKVSSDLAEKVQQYFVDVKKDYGAKADGVTDDTVAIQNAINSGKNVYLPSGTFLINSQITIPVGFSSRKIFTDNDAYRYETILKCNVYPAIINNANGVTFDKVKFTTNVASTNANDCFVNNFRLETGVADVDVYFKDCNFTGTIPYAVKIKGRNITFDNCLAFDVSTAFLQIKAMDSYDGEADTDPYLYDNQYSGMRGFVFKNNRMHYLRKPLIENLDPNGVNIKGVQIVGNFLEGTMIVKGALCDALVTGNHIFQLSTSSPVFDCTTLKNCNISGNIFKGEDSYNGLYETSMENLLIASTVENVNFSNNFISNVRANVFWLNGTSQNVRIYNNVARRICTVSGSYITLTGTSHDNLSINDTVESPERSNWVGVSYATATITKYDITLNIKGSTFSAIHNLLPGSSDVYSKGQKITGFYVGDGAGAKTLNLLFTPKLFEIQSNDGISSKAIYGSSGQYVSLGTRTASINTAMNVSGKVYIYSYQ